MNNAEPTPNTPESPQIDLTAYWKAGASWEAELYRKERRSRKIAWTVATVAGVSTLLGLSALNLLVPLKQFEAVVVIADKTTGFVEVARSLNESKLSENDAIKTANIVRYIRARETYDPRALKDNYDLAQLYSTGQASADLRHAATESKLSYVAPFVIVCLLGIVVFRFIPAFASAIVGGMAIGQGDGAMQGGLESWGRARYQVTGRAQILRRGLGRRRTSADVHAARARAIQRETEKNGHL